MDTLSNIVGDFRSMFIKVKQPKTICPKHGDTKGFNINFDGTNYCLYCVKEKMVEIGICEVVVEKDSG